MNHVMDLVSLFTMAAKKLNHFCGPRFPGPWTLSWAVCTTLTPGCSQLSFSRFFSDSISLPSYFFLFKPFYSWIVCQLLRDTERWPFQEHRHDSNRVLLRIKCWDQPSRFGAEKFKGFGGSRTAPGHDAWRCSRFVRPRWSLQSPAWPPLLTPAGALTDQILILAFDWLPPCDCEGWPLPMCVSPESKGNNQAVTETRGDLWLPAKRTIFTGGMLDGSQLWRLGQTGG